MNYNAYDIERYLKGQMNAAEMHAFETALMDDPFLSDAVDGYRSQLEHINIRANLKELKSEINNRKNKAAVVPLSFRKWMSVAAGFIVVLSLSVVLYRIYYSSKENNVVAVTEQKENDTVAVIPQTKFDSADIAINELRTGSEPKPFFIPSKKAAIIPKNDDTKEKASEISENDPSVAMNEVKILPSPPSTASSSSKPLAVRSENPGYIAPDYKKQAAYARLNKFTGKVVDENNNPLPFANITEVNSGVGTYADVNGNFNLVSSDSVLHIETKSVGYNGIVSQLNYNTNQRIVLKDDAVVANAPTAKDFLERQKNRKSKMEEDIDETESEPADGWKNYNTYVANNIREPLNFDKKQQSNLLSKEVSISFDVLPDGNITNLKVEKSNCTSCNSEAIRLLKEGPKWKSKTGKTERTRYTVQF